MGATIVFLFIWFLVSIPTTFFIGAILRLTQPSSQDEQFQIPRRSIVEVTATS